MLPFWKVFTGTGNQKPLYQTKLWVRQHNSGSLAHDPISRANFGLEEKILENSTRLKNKLEEDDSN